MKNTLSSYLNSGSLNDQLEAIQLLMRAKREGLEIEVIETAEEVLESNPHLSVPMALELALFEWDC